MDTIVPLAVPKLTPEQELLFAILEQLELKIDISAFPPNQQQKQEADQ